MGPSGSGKSTLMHCLAGLDELTDGRVLIGDVDLTELNDKKLTQLRRDRLGFIFQAFNLVPTLTALENITLPMDLAGRKPDREWVDLVVEHRRPRAPAPATDRASSPAASSSAWPSPGRWPAGPSSASPTSRPATSTAARGAEILAFMRSAVRDLGQTIVMVTHDPVAASYADRVVFLADGHIVDELHQPTAESVLDLMKHLGR